MRKAIRLVLAFVCAAQLSGCGSTGSEKTKKQEDLVVAYQYSIAYAPLVVMKEQQLIEKYYDGDINISWLVLNSGSAINEGIVAGDIDVGAMGVAPILIGIQAGIPYKVCFGISSQPYDIMTNNADIQVLSDISDENKIAVVGLNSQPHILLAMAAKEYLGDAHALDKNLVTMSNGDGMTALLSGAVDCQMCISPYNLMEAKEEGIHAVWVDRNVWPEGDSFIAGVASVALYDSNPALYAAVCSAMEEAIDFVNNNPAEVAHMLCKEYDASEEDLIKWLTESRSLFSTRTQGIIKLAIFMEEEGFIEKAPGSYADIAYENVTGD